MVQQLKCFWPYTLFPFKTKQSDQNIKSAFHGSADAAKVLLSKDDFDGITLGLHKLADKEGKTAFDHAKEEGNDDVAKVIEEAETPALGDGSAVDGLRKRK